MGFHIMKCVYCSIIIALLPFENCLAQKTETTWQNPIYKGINRYGMKDFFSWSENDSLYLVGSEYGDPFNGYTGPNVYTSKSGINWQKMAHLIDHRQIPDTAWYKDVWAAPELFKYENQYYFTFNSRNNDENAYQKLGFGIAKSNTLKGPYEIINTAKPMVLANHGSITISPEEVPYLTYDMDGRIYIAEVDLETATLKHDPVELLGPATLREHYKYLDAPNITKIDNIYHMLFTQFYGGYVVKVFHMTAAHPKGPWQWSENNPLYTFLEAEADLEVKMDYPEPHGFAPPTQVIFSHDLVKSPTDDYLMLYHSSEKYSEPYLNIEPISITAKGLIRIHHPKVKKQKLVFDEN